MTKKKIQTCTEEFRKEAVLRADKSGSNATSVGKEHGSFEIEVINQVVVLRSFGAWNVETAIHMRNDFQQIASKIANRPWACLVDLRSWELGGPEIWSPIERLNMWCDQNNQKLEAVVCSLLIQKHLLENAQKALLHSETEFFDNINKAKIWLNTKGYEI